MAPTLIDILQFYAAGFGSDDLLKLYNDNVDTSRLDERIDRTVMYNQIIDTCGSSYTACDNIAALIKRTQTFFDTNAAMFNKLWSIYVDDRDYKQTFYHETDSKGQSVRTPDLIREHDDTDSPSTTTTSTTSVSAYNESGFSDRDRTVTNESGEDKSSGKSTEKGTDTKDYQDITITKGYDGNPSELYLGAIEAEKGFNFYKFVAAEYDNEICLGVY